MFMKTLILVFLLLAVTNVNAGIFKWVDENGVTHYSEKLPPRQKAIELQAQPAPPVAGDGSVNPETKRWQKLETEFQKRKAEREASEKIKELEDANAKQLAVENKTKCISAQQNLSVLQLKRPVFTLNEKGERVYLNDETHVSEIERMKKDIKAYCEHQ